MRERTWTGYLSLLIVCALTGLMVWARDYLLLTDVVTLYLLVIMIGAFRFDRSVSVALAALSVAAYDFFFVPPIYQFAMTDTRHILSFALMFIVALTINSLASRIRRQGREARLREGRAQTLAALAAAADDAQSAGTTASHAAFSFGGSAAVFLRDDQGALVLKGTSTATFPIEEPELEPARWAWENGKVAGKSTQAWPRCRSLYVPFQPAPRGMGVLLLRCDALEADQHRFLESFVRQAALAMERVQLSEAAKTSSLRARTEEMRSSLLSAVSHDLRTPLATITAAGSTLRDEEGRLSEVQRVELLDTICSESERMEKLIGNLLDMMRLESGGFQPKREWVPLEEIVGSALTRLEPKLEGRALSLALPEGLPLVSVDPVLFEQVFINLLDNALKYTPSGSPIAVGARVCDGLVEIEVADRGVGLPAGKETAVFGKFWRGNHPGVGGVGLGLSICQGIVQAHGGTITAIARPGGGASFRIGLPVPAEPTFPLRVGEERGLECNPH